MMKKKKALTKEALRWSLMDSILKKDIRKIRSAIRQGAVVDDGVFGVLVSVYIEQDKKSQILNLEISNVLMEKSFYLDDKEDMAIRWFIKMNDLARIKQLERWGANLRVDQGEMLTYAAYTGALEIVKYLVEDLNFDVHQNKERALLWSIMSDKYMNDSVANYLCDLGFNINEVLLMNLTSEQRKTVEIFKTRYEKRELEKEFKVLRDPIQEKMKLRF